MRNKTIAIFLGLFLALVSGFWLITSVHAANTITVNTTEDEINADGDCSLREAIISANNDTKMDECNTGSGDDTIIVPSGTYVLTLAGKDEDNTLTGDLDIISAQGLTIQGAGVTNTIIDGGGIDRVFHIFNQDSHVTIKELTIQHGTSPEGSGGGGILNNGTLTLVNVLVEDNTTSGDPSYDIGGGICNGCGTGKGWLTLINSTISSNQSTRGGAIFSNHVMTITRSAIISNTAYAGGGLVNYGQATLTNSTVSNNIASGNSTNILQESEAMTITNSTISNNIDQSKVNIRTYGGSVTFVNTIVYSCSNYNCFGSGTITSLGYNLDNGNSCGFASEGDLTNTDPLLGPLADNGGSTLTQALLKGSPAIDAGSNAFCPPTDQRGFPRPFGPGCDIGAYEYKLWQIFLPVLLLSQ